MLCDVSFIIVNYNTCGLLEACLTSIFQNGSAYQMEVIVFDNASVDDSIRMVKTKYPEVKLIASETNVGFAKGNNLAYKESNGRYVIYLNSDTIIKEQAIDKMVRFLEGHPEVDILGPKLLNADGTLQISIGKLPNLLNSLGDPIFAFFDSPWTSMLCSRYPAYDKIMQVGWISGACVAARRGAVEALGGWDESFFMYGEDAWLGIRARQLGLKVIYFPEAKIIHLRGKSSKIEHQRILQVYEGRIKVRKNYFKLPSFSIFLLSSAFLIYLRSIIYFVFFALKSALGRNTTLERDKMIIYYEVTFLHLRFFVTSLVGLRLSNHSCQNGCRRDKDRFGV